jgi:hypothetical protein
MAGTHVLRQGPGGGDPPIEVDGRAAWRRDIDHEYHLHYWVGRAGVIELAAVVPHNEFGIPSPDF